ncbi:MAG: hypothetical protein Rubg2KO_33870 [Rubricoccaceae bacterium]
MRVAFLLVLMAVCASPARAQAFGSCITGTAIQFLESATLRASVFNTGGLFFGGSTTSGDGYIIPRAQSSLWRPGQSVSPLFAAGLWLGGEVEGEMRVAAARYGGYDFWPGPLEDAASPPTDCSEHDRIYLVSRSDIEQYYRTGELTDDLRDWPHQLGAPVLDGDGDSTNYDLRAGDQPDLIGDQAAWWVMNDAGNDHNPGAPLGVEVQAHAFIYGRTTATTSPALAQTTFIRYEVINRGDKPIEPMYASLFSDPDLGNAGDDYMGSDTLRNMVFVYNDSNEDVAYGVPPSQGVQVLQGPVGLANGRDDDRDGEVDEPGEQLRATAASVFDIGPAGTQDPGRPEEYYNFMQGLWGNGLPYYELNNGFEQFGAPITTFMMAGDPVTESFYSEVNTDGNGANFPQGDRRMAVSTGPFRLDPDSTATLFYAFPFGQGDNYLHSVAVMRGYAAALQSLHALGAFTSRPVERSGPKLTYELAMSRVRPNPSSGAAEVILTLPAETVVHATIVDALGRQLETVVDGVLPEGETVLAMPAGLAPGTYVLRVQVAPGAEETLTFTVAR